MVVSGTVGGANSGLVCSITTEIGDGTDGCMGYSDYGTTAYVQDSIGQWIAQGQDAFTDFTGGNVHVVPYDLQEMITISLSFAVADQGAPTGALISLSGCDVSPTTIVGDGTSYNVTADPNCEIQVPAAPRWSDDQSEVL